MATPDQFAREMSRLALSIEPRVASVMRRVAGQLLEDLVRGTPVDTGRARSNWQVSVGTAPRGVRRPYSPGERLGISETSNANAAIAAGRLAIQRFTDKTLDAPLVIGNTVFYVDSLRNGSSGQQPVDWVSIALARARTSLRLTNILERGARR